LKTNIIITTQVEGIHSWPECDLKDVEFLKYPHRHIFHIVAKKPVTHLDRDIEIIMLKRALNDYIKRVYWNNDLDLHDFKNMSCEMIAQDLLERFDLIYCSVLEDNENGAEVHF
jgi:hypothetical protein